MITIRPEIPEDITSIYHLNRAAFGQKQEAGIVDKLRERGVLTLSLVAAEDGVAIGHIAFSPVKIISEELSFEALALAPMAVLPPHQNTGIGSKLVLAGIKECRRLGHEIMVVLGHPGYYPRFGFVPAKAKGIECEFEVPDEAWMVLELKKGALIGKRGTAHFQDEFKDVD